MLSRDFLCRPQYLTFTLYQFSNSYFGALWHNQKTITNYHSSAEEWQRLREEDKAFTLRQCKLEEKLHKAEDADKRAHDLEGQLTMGKVCTQQAMAEKWQAQSQQVEAEKEVLAVYKAVTLAFLGEPPLKKPCTEKHEFTLDGLKVNPVEYKEMNLQHLIYMKNVDTTCHEKLLKINSLIWLTFSRLIHCIIILSGQLLIHPMVE